VKTFFDAGWTPAVRVGQNIPFGLPLRPGPDSGVNDFQQVLFMKSRLNGTAVDALPPDTQRGGTPFDELGLAVSCREPLSHQCQQLQHPQARHHQRPIYPLLIIKRKNKERKK
jgi:hypothetical protein